MMTRGWVCYMIYCRCGDRTMLTAARLRVQRWATNCLISHNPSKMMRVAYQVRAAVDPNGICKAQVDSLVQRRVLVSPKQWL